MADDFPAPPKIEHRLNAIHVRLRRMEQIAYKGDMEYAELQGSILAIVWGIWFLCSLYESWGPFYPLFHIMIPHTSSNAPQYIWGSAFFILGALQMWGLLGDHYQIRRWTAFASLLIWLFTAFLVGIDNQWRTLVFPMTLAFAVAAAWGFVRIGRARVQKDATSPKADGLPIK